MNVAKSKSEWARHYRKDILSDEAKAEYRQYQEQQIGPWFPKRVLRLTVENVSKILLRDFGKECSLITQYDIRVRPPRLFDGETGWVIEFFLIFDRRKFPEWRGVPSGPGQFRQTWNRSAVMVSDDGEVMCFDELEDASRTLSKLGFSGFKKDF